MKEEIIRHLATFVSFRTVEGANDVKKECLDWMESAFLECSPEENDERPLDSLAPLARSRRAVRGAINNCPYLYLSHKNPKLLWFAHIDVVPAEDEQFTLRQEADKLIGRGTSDMKGSQLPFLLAYRDAVAAERDPAVSILLTSDEETAGPTIPRLLEEGVITEIPVAFTPDTGPRIVVEHKGAIWANLVCKGKGAHAAYPWDGENPSYLLAEALQTVTENFPDGTNNDWRLTISPTTLSGGTAQNQVPETVTCGLDIRFPPQDWSGPEEVAAHIKTMLPSGCTLETQLSADALGTDSNHPMVQLIKKIAEDVTGEEVVFEREHGGTDARYFGKKGIPAFLYGPEGGGLHGAYEWVSLHSLSQQYEMMQDLCKMLQED